MTKVVCLRTGEKYDIWVGRPSPFGNPFSHLLTELTTAQFKATSRFDAVRKHAAWLKEPGQRGLVKQIKQELRGKVLACACSQEDITSGMCHAVTLAKIADEVIH